MVQRAVQKVRKREGSLHWCIAAVRRDVKCSGAQLGKDGGKPFQGIPKSMPLRKVDNDLASSFQHVSFIITRVANERSFARGDNILDIAVLRVEVDGVVFVESHNCLLEDEPACTQEGGVDKLQRVRNVTRSCA